MDSLSGLKKTQSRLKVLEILEKENSPVDVNHIVGHVKDSMDLATIYRILEAFENKGIIEKVEFGEGKSRYEIKKDHHHHLICENCGRVEDVNLDFIEKMQTYISKDKGFNVKRHNLEFFGLCRNCQN